MAIACRDVIYTTGHENRLRWSASALTVASERLFVAGSYPHQRFVCSSATEGVIPLSNRRANSTGSLWEKVMTTRGVESLARPNLGEPLRNPCRSAVRRRCIATVESTQKLRRYGVKFRCCTLMSSLFSQLNPQPRN